MMPANSGEQGMNVVVTTRDVEMAAFDALPPDLRDLICEASEQLSCVEVLEAWQRLGGTELAAAAVVEQIKAALQQYRAIRSDQLRQVAREGHPIHGALRLRQAVRAAERRSEERQKKAAPGG